MSVLILLKGSRGPEGLSGKPGPRGLKVTHFIVDCCILWLYTMPSGITNANCHQVGICDIVFNGFETYFQGRTGQRGHTGMPGPPVSVHTQILRVLSVFCVECWWCQCWWCLLQGLPGPPGPFGAEGKPGTQVPILYSNTMITVKAFKLLKDCKKNMMLFYIYK